MTSEILHTATASIGDLPLRSGQTLRDVQLAYATAGTLNAARDNTVLVTHGFTSSHMFIGRANASSSEGTWSGLVGAGKAIDTDRYFVVSSNMLGSSFGSTSPASVNPDTGRRYGLDFPDITVSDIVSAQQRMLHAMGIERLHAVVGPSYGGFQGLVWAIEHPEALRGLAMSVSGLHPPKDATPEELIALFSTDPNWHGGQHYDHGGIPETMARMREQTMRDYGIDVLLAEKFPDAQDRDHEMRRQAQAWAQITDPNSLIVLARAMQGFDMRKQLAPITAKVQYVLSRTDRLFPPSEAPAVMQAFADADVDAEYYQIDSDYGHHAAGTDSAKWAAELERFLRSL